MNNALKSDSVLFFTVGALVFFGLIMLGSASAFISQVKFGHPYYYLFRQLMFGLTGGLIGFLIAQRVPYQYYKKFAVVILLANVFLLMLVFIAPFGFGYGGATRWIQFGSFSFQPGEFIKLSLIIYLAAWFSARQKEVSQFFSGLIPFLTIAGGVGLLLMLQPDIGTLGVLTITAALMYFAAGAKLRHIFLVVVLGVAGLFALIQLAPYRLNRLVAFLNPDADPLGIGYQINQATLAVGSGGLWGLGFGNSRQKYLYLPEVVGDSVFAVFAEEMGFIAAVILISLFFLFALRGFKIAKNAPDAFGAFMAVGITSWIAVQAFINIAAISGLIPLTGIPLPFVSYGGSALAITLTAAGILVNISKQKTV